MRLKKYLFFTIVLFISLGLTLSVSAADKKSGDKDQSIAVEKTSNKVEQKADSISGQININTASQKELEKLKKVGPKTANAIIEYRKAHGPFKKAEDIKKVKGIGDKIFELNKDLIVVN